MVSYRASFYLMFVVTLFAACGGKPGSTVHVTPADDCAHATQAVLCQSGTARNCFMNKTTSTQDCTAARKICVDDVGCRTCAPGRISCMDNTVYHCDMAGENVTRGETCDATMGEYCSPEGCKNLCAEAETARAYFGCEYWPVSLPNGSLDTTHFHFAVAVANPQLVPANVVVRQGSTVLNSAVVDPGQLLVITLPWVSSLVGANAGNDGSGSATWAGGGSIHLANGAYHLTTNVPVVAYQFNALEYTDGINYSYTNDASLLLPTHALTGDYVGVARQTFITINHGMTGQSSGFLAIVGTSTTTTNVTVRFKAHVRAMQDNHAVSWGPGDEAQFTLEQGEVIALLSDVPPAGSCPGGTTTEVVDSNIRYCDPGADYDLTGTEITADQSVAVYGGHDCTFVPYNKWACDHIEEQLFPVESWDTTSLFSRTEPVTDEPNILRVLSSTDHNEIVFTPTSVHAPITLNRDQFIEFEVREDVLVSGSKPLLVAQYLVGQDYDGYGSGGLAGLGDPDLALVPPNAQLRSDYIFLAPDTYEQNFMNVTTTSGASVLLDGVPVAHWLPSATANYQSAHVQITGGVHEVKSAVPFALQVYGFGAYTSYTYTGGLDLTKIAPPLN